VLNPGGVSIGSAEIYRQVEKVAVVVETILVGQRWDEDVRVVLFVVLKPDEQLNDSIIEEIRQTVRTNTTPRHMPLKFYKSVLFSKHAMAKSPKNWSINLSTNLYQHLHQTIPMRRKTLRY
jgi:acyl-coenzyme A synthetase/AMP-(fatty) acid ligase